MSEYYYIEYGALQANGKRLIECETSALEAKKITEDFAREIADALNGREALKQEKAEIEANALAVGGIVEASRHKPSGNAGAMREALERLRTEIERFYNNKWIPYDAWQGCDDVISHALSASARNCDRFTSIEEARTAYCSECGRMISIWDGNESWLFEEWLFATAAERKGECNGK